jgi:hypothetical protein
MLLGVYSLAQEKLYFIFKLHLVSRKSKVKSKLVFFQQHTIDEPVEGGIVVLQLVCPQDCLLYTGKLLVRWLAIVARFPDGAFKRIIAMWKFKTKLSER